MLYLCIYQKERYQVSVTYQQSSSTYVTIKASIALFHAERNFYKKQQSCNHKEKFAEKLRKIIRLPLLILLTCYRIYVNHDVQRGRMRFFKKEKKIFF